MQTFWVLIQETKVSRFLIYSFKFFASVFLQVLTEKHLPKINLIPKLILSLKFPLEVTQV